MRSLVQGARQRVERQARRAAPGAWNRPQPMASCLASAPAAIPPAAPAQRPLPQGNPPSTDAAARAAPATIAEGPPVSAGTATRPRRCCFAVSTAAPCSPQAGEPGDPRRDPLEVPGDRSGFRGAATDEEPRGRLGVRAPAHGHLDERAGLAPDGGEREDLHPAAAGGDAQ